MIGLSELVIGIVGIRRSTRSNNFSRSMSTTTLYPSATYSDAFLNAWWARYVRAGSRSSTPKRSDPAAGPDPRVRLVLEPSVPTERPFGQLFPSSRAETRAAICRNLVILFRRRRCLPSPSASRFGATSARYRLPLQTPGMPGNRDRGGPAIPVLPLPHHQACGSAPGGSVS